MIQGTNCDSLSEFGVRHHSQIWLQSMGVFWADFVPHAVNRRFGVKNRALIGDPSKCGRTHREQFPDPTDFIYNKVLDKTCYDKRIRPHASDIPTKVFF